MTKRYPFGGAFGCGDARDASDFEGVPLGILQPPYGADDGGLHFYETAGGSSARGGDLGGDIHHSDVAGFAVVRELFHAPQEKLVEMNLRDIFAHQHVNTLASRQSFDFSAHDEETIGFRHGDGIAGALPGKWPDLGGAIAPLHGCRQEMSHAGPFFEGFCQCGP